MNLVRLISITSLWTVLVTSNVAMAAPPSPAKPSQILAATAANSSPPCINGSSYFPVNRLVNPDGSVGAFAIPPKSVFIVTSFDFGISGAPANKFVEAGVVGLDPANPPTGTPNAAITGVVADSDGRAVGSKSIPDGLVIKPPAVPCAEIEGTQGGAMIVHGFFAKDK
jgi:hypothetical protein